MPAVADTSRVRRVRRSEVEPFVTRDGSLIRELMHPDRHGCVGQSLAEATVEAGARTVLHRHRKSEEFYHILSGQGRMRLGDAVFTVIEGDTIAIPPGSAHNIEAVGEGELVFLCCCVPPYSHEDTELLEPGEGR